jgi:hypothetical protein
MYQHESIQNLTIDLHNGPSPENGLGKSSVVSTNGIHATSPSRVVAVL